MSESLKWSLLGLVSVIFGVIILANAVVASLAVAALTGALLLAGGVMQFIGGLSVDGMGSKVFAWFTGAVMAFLGWSFLSHPLQGVISLSMLILMLLVAGGVMRILFSFRMSGTGLFLPMILSGVMSLVLAAIIWGNVKADPAWLLNLLGILLGIEMLFNGFGLIFVGMFAKKTGA